ncbi:MAG: hypothetical protein EON59_03380 [Alphaproteobacteria bacterium]|nr:MAG: hypothetical protein EON59_03380 [Alphaproteobacteria bacterium]
MMAASWKGLSWTAVGEGLRHVHSNGPTVARLAQEAGKVPEDVAAIWLANAPAEVLPVLVFADGSIVSMEGAGRI